MGVYRSLFTVLLLLLAATPSVKAGEGVLLSLSLREDETSSTNSLEVDVKIINATDSPIVIGGIIVPKQLGVSKGYSPANRLQFNIRDEQGEPVPFTAKLPELTQKLAHPGTLFALAPGDFFGKRIDLSRGLFAHGLPTQGTVMVVAKLEIVAGEWTRRMLDLELQKRADFAHEPAWSYDGSIVSNELRIEIGGTSQ